MTEEKVGSKESGTSASEARKPEKTHGACHHHGWLGKHFCTRNLKRFGVLGVVIFVLHILFHVVEILLIPTILVWLGLN